MSLPLLKPLLLTIGATSLVFFGGVIALAVQSPEPINPLSVPTLLASNLITQDAGITSDLSSLKAMANPLLQSSLAKQSSLAALTAAQATALAKQNAPSAVLQATPELINYNGTVAYEVLLDSGTAYIDANLGNVLNPVATNNYRIEGFDGFDDDDDDYDYDYDYNDDFDGDNYDD
jgi:hypothetical protein